MMKIKTQKNVFILIIVIFNLLSPILANNAYDEPKGLKIVCTSYDVLEMIQALGCSKQVIGKPDGYQNLKFNHAKKVGSFLNINTDIIQELSPDLVITYSDIQAEIAKKLVLQHFTVLSLNHHDIQGIFESLLLLGKILGVENNANKEILNIRNKINEYKKSAPSMSKRPTVYFEEYDTPYISCTKWVSEMIEIAGGININQELSMFKSACKRVVTDELMIKKNPNVIIVAWCGKPFDKEKIKSRQGWDRIEAVKKDRIYSMPPNLVLQASPVILEGIAYMRNLLINEKNK